MFENTRGLIDKTIKELRVFVFIISILSQGVTAGYMIYNCASGNGFFALNLAMAAVCGFYLLLSTVHFVAEGKDIKRGIGNAKSITKRIKLVIKTAMLSISIYGIYLADKDASTISVILATLSIILWIAEIVFEIAYSYLKIRGRQFVDALKEDVKPANLAGGAVKLAKSAASKLSDSKDAVLGAVKGKIADAGVSMAKAALHKIFDKKQKNAPPEIPAPRAEEKENAEVK